MAQERAFNLDDNFRWTGPLTPPILISRELFSWFTSIDVMAVWTSRDSRKTQNTFVKAHAFMARKHEEADVWRHTQASGRAHAWGFMAAKHAEIWKAFTGLEKDANVCSRMWKSRVREHWYLHELCMGGHRAWYKHRGSCLRGRCRDYHGSCSADLSDVFASFRQLNDVYVYICMHVYSYHLYILLHYCPYIYV